ncbi:hypothetical protein Q1695_013005 [Nippostrongylus brasiliensis]|nr:hypothetical protein Q1695_013005 [Nippostrongylus brasiliensis]
MTIQKQFDHFVQLRSLLSELKTILLEAKRKVPSMNTTVNTEAIQNYKETEIAAIQKGLKKLSSQTGAKNLRFPRRAETAHVDCGRVLRGDIAYTTAIAAKRPVLAKKSVNMSCEAIRKRVLPPIPMQKVEFGVAFARVVFKDYIQIEEELRSSYHPQNFFCYSIDKKADKDFHEKMKQLTSCIPNTFLTTEEYDVDSAGHFMHHAFYNCMRLLTKEKGWGYILLQQNHDIAIKSTYEMVEIYKLLGGANDVEITPCPASRWNHSMKWDARSLKLFVNESATSPSQLNATITFAKGSTSGSLSREAVDWLVSTVNLTILLNQLNSRPFGVDELLLQSLQISDELDMPGRFTSECLLKRKKNTDYISRMAHWVYGGPDKCRSRRVRKSVCILGIEDFQLLSKYPNLMANKMLPDFDYSVVECMHELIFNRTFLNQIDHPVDKQYYSNMVNVKYHKNRLKPDPNYKLECVSNLIEWAQYPYP